MKIIECPRDAMQGIEEFIPTQGKIEYINQLLKVGFDTIDFGSFVSPKSIPQMVDSVEVLKGLDINNTKSKLLAIVANFRGAQDAVQHEEITYLGYPFSISETFQKRNTNKSIVESLNILGEIQELCVNHNKTLVVYLSMGFGNPYGDPYNKEIVHQFADIMVSLDISTISLADTIGSATDKDIMDLFTFLIPAYPNVEFGAHLHSVPDAVEGKIKAVIDSGCRRIDGALKGFGGCPFAKDDLTGNIATEKIVEVAEKSNIGLDLNRDALDKALLESSKVF